MKVTTETGSVYSIEHNLCTKVDKNGLRVDQFKVWIMKPVPDYVTTWEEIRELPEGEPVVGQRLYLSGREGWWISTRIVKVER